MGSRLVVRKVLSDKLSETEEVRVRETITMVVTVMAYPAISTKHGETVCVAGIRTDQLMTSSWVRLFPFKVRDMPTAARIHKWDEIEVEVVKASGDHRPESYTPNLDSIRVIRRLGTERRGPSVVQLLIRFRSNRRWLTSNAGRPPTAFLWPL